MAVSEDKCVTCSSRARPHNLEIPPNLGLLLRPDGSFHDLPYWFCSVKCFQKAIGKYLDPRYGIDKKPEDDEGYDAVFKKANDDWQAEFISSNSLNPFERFKKRKYRTEMDRIRDYADTFVEAFKLRQIDEIENAQVEIYNRLDAEAAHQNEQEAAEITERIAKLQVQTEKLVKEREAREAEQEKWRAKKFEI